MAVKVTHYYKVGDFCADGNPEAFPLCRKVPNSFSSSKTSDSDLMKKDYVQSEKNCQQRFLKRQGKIQLNQFKSMNTKKTGIWESPKKQMKMIHHQGTDTSNAHVQLAQQLILCNLNLTV